MRTWSSLQRKMDSRIQENFVKYYPLIYSYLPESFALFILPEAHATGSQTHDDIELFPYSGIDREWCL